LRIALNVADFAKKRVSKTAVRADKAEKPRAAAASKNPAQVGGAKAKAAEAATKAVKKKPKSSKQS